MEYLKYQVWLVGHVEDCKEVRQLLNYDKVHLLGELRGGELVEDNAYVIICSTIDKEELKKLKNGKIVRYDFLRICAYKLSPETAYLDRNLRNKLDTGIEGVVTGLSYEQRGLIFDKIERNIVCLATPSQDLYLDYQNFLWIYNEVVVRRQGEIKYCIIGMDFYRLWYDLSLSLQKERMLCFYNRLRCVHHYHDMDSWLMRYDEEVKICEELMIENYMDKDFCDNFHLELYYGEIKEQYEMTDETYSRDSEEVKKVFNKPYPLTFHENIGILERFLKFLSLHHIKIIVYIPPFPKIFNEFTSADMKQTTLAVLSELKERYEYEILDLSENKLFSNKHFADWCHLNAYGADLATELLNDFMRNMDGKEYV